MKSFWEKIHLKPIKKFGHQIFLKGSRNLQVLWKIEPDICFNIEGQTKQNDPVVKFRCH